jgi:hypothetical protein
MAINFPVLDIIAKVARERPAPRRMLCLGYPDMLVTGDQIARVCGAEALAKIEYRDDSEAILRWHTLAGKLDRVPETSSVFATLGVQCDFIDIKATRGMEVLVDLNQPAPPELLGRYDVVYDGGTMEHCFNVGQVMRNIFAFAAPGGFIVHVNPINFYNHGFFNFNPTFYHDWYVQSGNAIVTPFYAMHGPILESQLATLDPIQHFNPPEVSVMLVAAQRLKGAMPPWPMQSKYLVTTGLKG